VLQALLGSFAPSSSQNGPKLSADQVNKLSEKLGELVGDIRSAESGDERGEVR
jgi:hypothetical protein